VSQQLLQQVFLLKMAVRRNPSVLQLAVASLVLCAAGCVHCTQHGNPSFINIDTGSELSMHLWQTWVGSAAAVWQQLSFPQQQLHQTLKQAQRHCALLGPQRFQIKHIEHGTCNFFLQNSSC
jgi:hypothetical protein